MKNTQLDFGTQAQQPLPESVLPLSRASSKSAGETSPTEWGKKNIIVVWIHLMIFMDFQEGFQGSKSRE